MSLQMHYKIMLPLPSHVGHYTIAATTMLELTVVQMVKNRAHLGEARGDVLLPSS